MKEIEQQNKFMRINCKSFIDENERLAEGWNKCGEELKEAYQIIDLMVKKVGCPKIKCDDVDNSDCVICKKNYYIEQARNINK